MSSNPKHRLIAVVGSTATGKSRVAVELADSLDGEIINVDSRLFYRGMDVATAKPNAAERRGMTHHLIDILDPDEPFSLSEFLDRARATITDISSRGKLPILVGGSGQYVWALLEGWKVPEIEPDQELRTELENTLADEGVSALVSILTQLSPEIAEKTERENPRRVIRAIERIKSGASSAFDTRSKPDESPYDARVIGLSVERSVLHQRVLDRLELMKSNGWFDEVVNLREAGYSDDGRALSGIGYRQMIGHLDGKYDFDEAVRKTAVATNRLIRQQGNWFRRDDPRISWFDMTNDENEGIRSIVDSASRWLENL